jgi:hypothetical protein
MELELKISRLPSTPRPVLGTLGYPNPAVLQYVGIGFGTWSRCKSYSIAGRLLTV